jgi:hypothetical protein
MSKLILTLLTPTKNPRVVNSRELKDIWYSSTSQSLKPAIIDAFKNLNRSSHDNMLKLLKLPSGVKYLYTENKPQESSRKYTVYEYKHMIKLDILESDKPQSDGGTDQYSNGYFGLPIIKKNDDDIRVDLANIIICVSNDKTLNRSLINNMIIIGNLGLHPYTIDSMIKDIEGK